MNKKESIQPSLFISVALAFLQQDVSDKTDRVEQNKISLITTKEIYKKEYFLNCTDLNS